MEIEIKRIYEEADPGDGRRILVDRLWPRGISKEKAGIDQWCKEIAPSKELRTRYHRGDMDFLEFAREYTRELNQNPASPEFLDSIRNCGRATFRLIEQKTCLAGIWITPGFEKIIIPS